MIDLEDSCSSCLISQIPNIYGLRLNDHQWTTAMRMRCFLWPCSLPNDLICRCKSVVTLSHILNCKYFITYRSIVHDSVRDQLYAMCKSFNIEAFIEPLVRKLSSDQTDDSFGKRRADLVAPGIDGVLNVDFVKSILSAFSVLNVCFGLKLITFFVLRPIAIGESFSRILASLVFNRIGKKAKKFFSPFQFGIKTIDGASSAALSSDVFFNSSDSNYIFNLDFKNAFNSVSRSSILPLLQKHFPEVEPFFYSFYGKSSTLVYENFDLLSSSGVKQGDPLGPFFFCLAIHPLMCELKEKFPELDIAAYMDDISVIAPITILKQIATFIQQRYEDIGLSLNVSKCLIIGHEPIDFFINDVNVSLINYDQSGFRFLCCYLGNIDEVKNQLSTLLTQFGNELESIENLNIEKHLKFFCLKI
ncbi:hypothetical protein P9112_013316 [Eukaryota sp. TZLM1-RC]